MKTETELQANTLGDWAKLAIKKHFEKTIKYEPDVLQDKDPEDLHQMRVGMRRLRSAVTGFAPALALPKPAQEKQIGKISKALGKLRDLDVLLENIKTRYQPNLPKKEQTIIEEALVKLASERSHVLKMVTKTLNHSSYQNLKESLANWIQNPTYQEMAQLPIQEVLPDLLLPEVSRLFLHPGWLVGVKSKKGKIEVKNLKPKGVDRQLAEQGTIVHSLRKEAKRVRYQMSLFTDFYGEQYGAYVEDMKAIQDVLGSIQDSQVLAEVLTKVLEADIDTKLPTLAKQLAETRYQLWQQWQPLHQKYFAPETRNAFRSQLLQPVLVSNHGNLNNGNSSLK